MELLDLVFLIPAFPLLGFLTLLVIGRSLGEPLAGWLATGAMAGSFAATVLVYLGLRAEDAEDRIHTQTLFEWIPAGDFSVDVGFLADPLSIAMCLFITGIGTLIHVYSVGYMHGEEYFSKFFLYLNLFAFSMLMLVLGDNLLLTFLGWEGVGACSYLLISFWFHDPANATAGKKAFVTNRIGDVGFMIATFLVFFTFGSITYSEFLPAAAGMNQTTATAITLLLFVGAMGKSAQFPLYLWLPDAMAGPTPVSALIHAATMVTSGIYLLTRTNGLIYEAAGWSTNIIAWVGVGTALFAATIAIAQTDIKKVLAYSTVSQLGYMFLAVGTGAYVAAIFHMITHAFFKALLFLGSGSVIHGMHHDQDMRNYGALRKLMPITAGTFIIGWLAIAGVPPFAGFWSKDEILLAAWDLGGVNGKALWAVGLLTALLTAFYMTRQVMMTFFGRYRYNDATPTEIELAWDNRIAASQDDVDKAIAAQDAAKENVEKATAAIGTAENNLEMMRNNVPVAETNVENAKAALAEATDENREQLTAQVAAAENGVIAAQTNITNGETAVAAARDNVPVAEQAVVAATATRTEAEGALATVQHERDATNIPEGASLFGEPDVGPVEEFLPESVAERREFHPHESPWTMTMPLGVLAVLSIVGGFLNLPFSWNNKWWHHLEHWLEPALAHEHKVLASGNTKFILALVAIAAGAIGIAVAYNVYIKGKGPKPSDIEKPVLANAWFYDLGISNFMGGPGRKLFDLITWFDANIVDGAVNGVGALVRGVGGSARRTQTGLVRTYAVGVAIGAVALIGWFVLRAAL